MTPASDPSRALHALRDVEVPLGARSRVRARIESQLDRRAVMHVSSHRRRVIGVLAVPVVAVVLLALWPRSEGRTLSVAAGERHDVELASGHVSIRGPAEVDISHDQLALVQGTLEARGQLHVKGPACDVVVQGSAEVSVTGARLRVRVFAGSVQIVPPVVTCEVIDLSPGPRTAALHGRTAAPPTIASSTQGVETSVSTTSEVSPSATEVVRPRPARAVASPHEPSVAPAAPPEAPARSPRPAPVAAPAPIEERAGAALEQRAGAASETSAGAETIEAPHADPLAAEVAAYHAAVALEARDLEAARRAWQAWRARWPNSSLAQSVDLHLLVVLDRLERHGAASDLAREFVRRYPRSPRRAEVQRLIVGAP